ncbi:MAG: RluA family pseudouridine synthase [Dysgonomonas sp.]
MRNTSRDKALQVLKVSEPSELLEFLIAKNVRKSRSAAKSLLVHKQILVNEKISTQYNLELKKGDIVAVMKFDQSRKEKRLKGLKIVFEDDDLIVVDKEAGILSVSTDKEKTRTVYSLLNEYVKKKKKTARVFVIHRLDREISGLMVFTKSPELQEMYQKNWDLLVPVHSYAAIINGVLNEKNGTITSWLTENKNFVVFSSPSDNGGLKSITHYKTIKSNGRYSLLEMRLETRRKNQIRAQMRQMNTPIIGDKKYGATTNPIKRIALHAQNMILKHPVTGNMIEFKSTIPKVMMQLLVETPKE